MNVISSHQPYASLIVAGIKLWGTRPYPPNGDMRPDGVRGLPGKRINAGDRILIHSASSPPKTPHFYGAWCIDENPLEGLYVDENDGLGRSFAAPLGAILGSVEVTRCLPVADYDTCTFGIHEPHICTSDSGRDLALVENGAETTISDQLPYGDWQPGRWAWELVNPIRTTAQCPACDGSGSVPARDPLTADMTAFGEPLDPCPACGCEGVCPPIPVKGKQGVWEWAP